MLFLLRNQLRPHTVMPCTHSKKPIVAVKFDENSSQIRERCCYEEVTLSTVVRLLLFSVYISNISVWANYNH